MLEKMGDFFDNRLKEYENHQLTCIESAKEFYAFTANCLPTKRKTCILDLGCGTGLELDWYFNINPSAKIVGIDLASKMLNTLKNKFKDKDITTINDSYFNVDLGKNMYDAVVSVESLHHFTKSEKIPLYTKIKNSIKPDGFFILTDFFSLYDEEEKNYHQELLNLKNQQKIISDEIYHYDTPLTVNHEKEALQTAGFSKITILKNWGCTYTIKAII